MSDERRRDLERRARQGDEQAAARARAERDRRLTPDPFLPALCYGVSIEVHLHIDAGLVTFAQLRKRVREIEGGPDGEA